MKKISINDILAVTGGTLIVRSDQEYITGVKHDSREVTEGDMFVAIIGEKQDGHKYIPHVIENGCNAVLASHTDGWFAELHRSELKTNIILVDDTVAAMGKLAAWYLDSLDIKKVAVTGSVGKTSTRDMIYYALSEKYNCGRNLKNYNNNIGLPISIFTFDETTDAAVLEMGMDDFGEISYLSGLVKPQIGVITNIGVSHLEKLGSRDGIFKAKMEITENLASKKDGGALMFIGDKEYLNKEKISGDFECIEIGGKKSDYVVSDIIDHGIKGIEFTVSSGKEKVKVALPIPGKHNAFNAAVALAVAAKLGVDLETAAKGIAKTELTGSRLRKVEGRSVVIIDDTYNANPASMMSALSVLSNSDAMRRVAILGDMLELGDHEERMHYRLGEFTRLLRIDEILTVGDLAEHISDGAIGTHFRNKEALFEVLEDYIHPGDLVLVKGSRGMKMEEIVERLKNM